MNRKKLELLFIFLFLSTSALGATSMNFLTKGYADTLYCRVNTGGNLQAKNITAVLFGDGTDFYTIAQLALDTNASTACDDGEYLDGSGICIKIASTYINATQSNAIAGTIDAGTLANTQHPDGKYDGITFNFSEQAGSPALDLRINFTNVSSFNQGVMRYYTSSLAGGFPIIQMWNYDSSIWEDYPPVGETETLATITQPVFDSSDHVEDGVAQMRIYKASNGNTNNHYYVDWIALIKSFGTPSGEEIDPYWHSEKGNYYNTSQTNTTIDSKINEYNGTVVYSYWTNITYDIELQNETIVRSHNTSWRDDVNHSLQDAYDDGSFIQVDDTDVVWNLSTYPSPNYIIQDKWASGDCKVNTSLEFNPWGCYYDVEDETEYCEVGPVLRYGMYPKGTTGCAPTGIFEVEAKPDLSGTKMDYANVLFNIWAPSDYVPNQEGAEAYFTIRVYNGSQLVEAFKIGNSISEEGVPENTYPLDLRTRGWVPLEDNKFDIGSPEFRFRRGYFAENFTGTGSGESIFLSATDGDVRFGFKNFNITNNGSVVTSKNITAKQLIANERIYLSANSYMEADANGNIDVW